MEGQLAHTDSQKQIDLVYEYKKNGECMSPGAVKGKVVLRFLRHRANVFKLAKLGQSRCKTKQNKSVLL